MTRLQRCLLITTFLVVVLAVSALALAGGAYTADPHTGGATGQPSQSCQAVFPSGTLVPNGFNTAGFANAGAHYAGSQPLNSNNPNSVSQYDVACFENGSHP
jgi:hypothetical protein